MTAVSNLEGGIHVTEDPASTTHPLRTLRAGSLGALTLNHEQGRGSLDKSVRAGGAFKYVPVPLVLAAMRLNPKPLRLREPLELQEAVTPPGCCPVGAGGRRCSALHVIGQTSAEGEERQKAGTKKSHATCSAGGDSRCGPSNDLRMGCRHSRWRPQKRALS